MLIPQFVDPGAQSHPMRNVGILELLSAHEDDLSKAR